MVTSIGDFNRIECISLTLFFSWIPSVCLRSIDRSIVYFITILSPPHLASERTSNKQPTSPSTPCSSTTLQAIHRNDSPPISTPSFSSSPLCNRHAYLLRLWNSPTPSHSSSPANYPSIHPQPLYFSTHASTLLRLSFNIMGWAEQSWAVVPCYGMVWYSIV